jgi:transcriptional regulator with XRE-family HTH domain
MQRGITGEQLRVARTRARLQNKELARLLGVHPRTLDNWLDTGVPTRSADDVHDKLAQYLDPPDIDAPPRGLQDYSDVELLAEVWRRMDKNRPVEQPAEDGPLPDPTDVRFSGEISGRTAGRPKRPPT